MGKSGGREKQELEQRNLELSLKGKKREGGKGRERMREAVGEGAGRMEEKQQ